MTISAVWHLGLAALAGFSLFRHLSSVLTRLRAGPFGPINLRKVLTAGADTGLALNSPQLHQNDVRTSRMNPLALSRPGTRVSVFAGPVAKGCLSWTVGWSFASSQSLPFLISASIPDT